MNFQAGARNPSPSSSLSSSMSFVQSHYQNDAFYNDDLSSYSYKSSQKLKHHQRVQDPTIELSSKLESAAMTKNPLLITKTASLSYSSTDDDSLNQSKKVRPLGTCVRKCLVCKQLKRIILAECCKCSRIIDLDLMDCSCLVKNNLENFVCTVCNTKLTLNGYLICVNRVCQTTISAIPTEKFSSNNSIISGQQSAIGYICYPKAGLRTIAINANTLNYHHREYSSSSAVDSVSITKENREFIPNMISIKDCLSGCTSEIDYSSLSSTRTATSSKSRMCVHCPKMFNRNAYDSNKSPLESERQQKSTLKSIDLSTSRNGPRPPNCSTIQDRLNRQCQRYSSKLSKMYNHQSSQTQHGCLTNIEENITCDTVTSAVIMRKVDETKYERQLQVNTLSENLENTCKTNSEIDISINVESPRVKHRRIEQQPSPITDKSLSAFERQLLDAITDRDGQKWVEYVSQLKTQTISSTSELVRISIEATAKLFHNKNIKDLTMGQIRRKLRSLMLQLDANDEDLVHRIEQQFTEDLTSIKSGIMMKNQSDARKISLQSFNVKSDKHPITAVRNIVDDKYEKIDRDTSQICENKRMTTAIGTDHNSKKEPAIDTEITVTRIPTLHKYFGDEENKLKIRTADETLKCLSETLEFRNSQADVIERSLPAKPIQSPISSSSISSKLKSVEFITQDKLKSVRDIKSRKDEGEDQKPLFTRAEDVFKKRLTNISDLECLKTSQEQIEQMKSREKQTDYKKKDAFDEKSQISRDIDELTKVIIEEPSIKQNEEEIKSFNTLNKSSISEIRQLSDIKISEEKMAATKDLSPDDNASPRTNVLVHDIINLETISLKIGERHMEILS
ncbi:unnamed protein product [Didymodactylos carnosus]|uniref:Uncharacterized protein n=1 Tax=Didymodactylos carnosus TaxID=1234261 RepID=A0A814RE89_9BILA|nr:unnamed protein product [Didymodactylos carnosus]CAF1132302.1 unnamed protein product [Didymodactylos carnosus]CAF3550948.1 unnamed protein product [Didymodactylos carnosus]CAF3896082.1 unnamed protein product [Didymodactylos carnosus]